MPMLRFLLVLTAIGLAAPVGAATAILDTVFLGSPTSEREHQFTASGKTDGLVLATTLGSLHRSHPVRMLAGADASLSWSMAVGADDTPILLEIQEIHDRRPQVFGYNVTVNGTDVYFRTYREVGAGPNHYFVDVPRRLAPDGKLLITLRNQGEAPVAIGRVWAYGDFERLAAADGTWKPMPVLGQARVMMGVIGTPGKHVALEGQIPEIAPERDAQAWKDLTATFAAQGTVAPGFMITSYYLQNNLGSLQDEIATSMHWAATNQVMWQYNFMGGDWGGHPSVLDGQGGDFYDIRYSQAVYDPVNRRYGPTWPGSPGGVIWPTSGEPALNRYIIARSREAGRMLGEQIGLLAARGLKPADICLVGDEGPSFWWEGGFGDFTPTLVAAAARDGVTLDPAAFTPAARTWLFNQLTTRFTERSQAITDGLGRDIIPVDHGLVTLPTAQLADTLYAHTFMNQSFPSFDPRWEGWQNGASTAAWIGGEPLEYVNPSISDYIASQGRATNVNLYRPIADFAYLEKLYQWGFQHVALFDAYSGDAEAIVKALAGLDQRPSLPARHYLRTLVDLDPALMPEFKFGGPMQEAGNLRFSPRLDTTFQLLDPAKTGRLVLAISDGGRPLPAGMILRLDFGDSAHQVGLFSKASVSAGSDPAHLQPLTRFTSKELKKTSYWPHFCTFSVPLGDALQGLQAATVEIDLTSAKDVNETGLRRLSITQPWSRQTGQLVGDPPSNRQARTRRLWMQDRAVVQRLITRFAAAGGDLATLTKAQQLIDAGGYRQAYSLVAGQDSLLLPARFAVRGEGRLGPYPVYVNWSASDRTALVCLQRVEQNRIELSIDTPTILHGEIRCLALQADGRYSQTIDPQNHLVITADPAGSLVAGPDGILTVNCDLSEQEIPGGDGFLAKNTGRVPGRTLVAMCTGTDLYEVQDRELSTYNPLRIVATPQAERLRHRDGDTTPPVKASPQTGDRVEITLDPAGRASALSATYGEVTGRIRTFLPPTVHPAPCNGIIELEDGRSFEFLYRMASFTTFKVPGLKPWARNNSIDDYTAAFKPGIEVKLRYSPSLTPASRPRLLSVRVGQE